MSEQARNGNVACCRKAVAEHLHVCLARIIKPVIENLLTPTCEMHGLVSEEQSIAKVLAVHAGQEAQAGLNYGLGLEVQHCIYPIYPSSNLARSAGRLDLLRAVTDITLSDIFTVVHFRVFAAFLGLVLQSTARKTPKSRTTSHF